MNAKKIFIITGEASGDLLGAGVMSSAQRKGLPIEFLGVGGSAMSERGLRSLFPISDLSVMGFAEVLPHLPTLLSRMSQTVKAIEAAQPDLVLTVDSPGFNFRVVKKLRKRGRVKCPVVHYVAPTVWAYKPERAKATAALFDHLLTLLPFEPIYFQRERLTTTFVGHPVVDDLDICFRQRMQSPPRPANRLHLCLMGGSREGELKRLMPIYEKVIKQIEADFPDFRLYLPATEDTAPIIEKMTKHWPWKKQIMIGSLSRYEAFYKSDFAICKSGTVTLEASKAGLPMVIVYKVNPLSARILKPMLKTKFFNLINIIQKSEVIPELIQKDCTVSKITAKVRELLESKHQTEKQKSLAYEALRKMQSPSGGSASDMVVLKLQQLMDGRLA